MNDKENFLQSISGEMSAEETLLAGLKGLIAAEIAIKRVNLRMNQKEFAEYMGATQSQVSKWETGECNFTLSTLVSIASKLDIKMQCPFVEETVFEYKEPEHKNNIYQFPQNATWRGCESAPSQYSVLKLDDLKEM